MVYNSIGTTFAQPSGGYLSANNPAAKEPTESYSGLTTAQCAANSALSSVAVTSTATSVEAAKVRTKGITLIVPTDQNQVTFGQSAAGVSAIPGGPVTPATQTGVPSTGGFAVPPGGSIFLSPYNGAVYAITPSGVTSTIYFIDT